MHSLKFKSTVLFLLFFITAGVNVLCAQNSRFSFNKYISNQDTLNYRLLFPDANNMRKYPLVVFLHGSGERGSDNEAQLKWGVMNFATDQAMALHPAIVVAPQCPLNMQWANFTGSNLQMGEQPKQTYGTSG